MVVLVITEKPSVAGDVARALSGSHKFSREAWGFKSEKMWVAAAAGHLVAELTPDEYDVKFKTWSYSDLPIIPERVMYKARDARAGERLRQLKSLINDAAVTSVVLATDAGREGELIGKLILQAAKNTKPIRRAWFSSMTDSAITEAFAALKDDDEMLPLEYAARCRSEADWLVGMNATRAASCTLGGQRQTLSLGRVQTPTLALIVRRDLEIEQFQSEQFFTVQAALMVESGEFTAKWTETVDDGSRDRFSDRAAAEQVAAKLRAATDVTIKDVRTEPKTANPPKLFDLTELQREANRKFGISAAQTLEAAQALYERHKVLSYPRTDSSYITADMASSIKPILQRVAQLRPELAPLAQKAVADGPPTDRIVDDAKVTDHHGLLPTNTKADLSALSERELGIYDLVCRRLVASMLPPHRSERTVIIVAADDETLRAAGTVEIERGWKAAVTVEEKDAKDAVPLPQMSSGQEASIISVEVVAGETKPPARLNEAALLGAMATAGALVSEEEASDAMKESGLGTPATRAGIIERLIKVGYIERSKKTLMATPKGRGVVVALGDHPLSRPDLTGAWEKKLRHIEWSSSDEAAALKEAFLADAKNFTAEIVAGFAAMTPKLLLAARPKIDSCPVPGCDGDVVESAKGWGCSSYQSAESSGCGFVVWKTSGGKRVTEKQLEKRIAAVRSGAEVVAAPVERRELADCPKCDGKIVTRAKSFGCSSWRSAKETGCGYVLWRTNPDGSELTEEQAVELAAAGKTNARELPPAFAPCPRCDGTIRDRGVALSCDSWRGKRSTGCGTSVWRTQSGVVRSDEELRAQLEALVGTKASKRRKS